MGNKKIFYTKEQEEFLINYIPGHSYANIVEVFLEKYPDTIFTINKLKYFMKIYHVKNGINSKFKKGVPSHNKGKKVSPEVYEKISKTFFKSEDCKRKPIGSERKSNGYIYVKVKEPNVWVLKHRYIWERKYGKIQDDQVLIFKNGNKSDVTLDNLMLISKNELLQLNKQNLAIKNKEIVKTMVNVIRLKEKIKEVDGRKNKL